MNKFLLLCAIIVNLFLIAPTLVGAQLNFGLSGSESNSLEVEVLPEFPGPNQKVTVILRLYSADLNTANIAWWVNAKKVAEGKGLNSFSFTTGNVGTKTSLQINITLANGVAFSKNLAFNPANVDLLWQADSYTPPFYKGRALFPKQGSVVIVAMPNLYAGTSKTEASKLIYNWTVNNKFLEGQSGYGKSTLRFVGPILGTSIKAEVEVTDPLGGARGVASLSLNPVNPLILFYENSPLYGIIFEQSLNKGASINGEEVSILASPYFASRGNDLSYIWKINGQIISGVTSPSATFRKPGGSGTTLVTLQIANPIKILQFAENSFNIKYND